MRFGKKKKKKRGRFGKKLGRFGKRWGRFGNTVGAFCKKVGRFGKGRFGSGGVLTCIPSNPYLGAELTNTMSWDKQVQKVVAKEIKH